MKARPELHLVVREDGRKDIGRQMLRAHLEQRYEDARALVDRIAHRASLMPIDRAERPAPRDLQGIDTEGQTGQTGPDVD